MYKTPKTLLNWDNKEDFPLYHRRNSCSDFTSGEIAGLAEELLDEPGHVVHAKWSRGIKKQCMKIIRKLAKDWSKVNRQKHGKKLGMVNWKLL